MKETIILAPGANGSEILRSLAQCGINTFNLRIMGSAELARFALMRSGIAIVGNFLDSKEEVSLLAEPVRGQAYFKNASLSDIEAVGRTIRTMRLLVADENEDDIIPSILAKGIFQDKNQALTAVYQAFRNKCSRDMLMDQVSLIRKAAFECKTLNAECLTISEYPLKPLEKKLLASISSGHAKEISLRDMYQCPSEKVEIREYRNCYGAPNEVESAIDEIYRGRSLDQCVCAVTDTSTYSQLFFDSTLLYDIPVTFGAGIPIVNSNPAKLLKLYGIWSGEGFFGIDSLNAMLQSPVFDHSKFMSVFPEVPEELISTDKFSWKAFWQILGSLRMTNEEAVNAKRVADYIAVAGEKNIYIPFIKAAAGELALPVWDFIYKYAKIRKNSKTNADKLLMKLDQTAASIIHDELIVFVTSAQKASMQLSMNDMIRSILSMSVCKESAKSGYLHVTTLSGAMSCVRKNLFVLGLSANNFPGSPRENYLLLDKDLELFGEEGMQLASDALVMEKKRCFDALIELYSGLGNNITLSYSGLNVSELKKANASSALFETYQKEHGLSATTAQLEEEIRKISYFAPAISISREIGAAYNEGLVVTQNELEIPENITVDASWLLDEFWSPSALSKFYECPRRFCLHYVCGIPEPEENDPFTIITPAQEGTLAHKMMETLANTSMMKETFLELCGQAFDEFLKVNPPLIAEGTDVAKDAFVEMMANSFDMDPHKPVEWKEKDVKAKHVSGVGIHGLPDRMEKEADGTYRIIDFKTGRNVNHTADDIASCLQVVIYAYLMEDMGYQISGCEYRYIRRKETVTCKYDDEMKDNLQSMLLTFKAAMENGDFPCAQPPQDKNDKNPCKYCSYAAICGRANASSEGGES